MNKVLYDHPFQIIQYDKISTLIFATLTFEDEEFIIRFREKNLEKIIKFNFRALTRIFGYGILYTVFINSSL